MEDSFTTCNDGKANWHPHVHATLAG